MTQGISELSYLPFFPNIFFSPCARRKCVIHQLATAREFDYNERSLIVAFARCRRTGGGGARCRAARPWLASPSILFFLSRPTPSHHAALFSKNPVLPLLIRPLQLLLLLLLPLTTLLIIVDIAIAVVDLAKLLLPFFFGSVCSVLALYVSIYMLCWRRLHKWRIARGLVVGATTVISYLLFLS